MSALSMPIASSQIFSFQEAACTSGRLAIASRTTSRSVGRLVHELERVRGLDGSVDRAHHHRVQVAAREVSDAS